MSAAFAAAAHAVSACASPSETFHDLGRIAHEPRRFAHGLSKVLTVLHLFAVLALVATYASHLWDLQDDGDIPLFP